MSRIAPAIGSPDELTLRNGRVTMRLVIDGTCHHWAAALARQEIVIHRQDGDHYQPANRSKGEKARNRKHRR
ncbi:hypothetical protein 9F2_28 [uncultured Caudovirales phage]|uniref:Uncharacterized protein n=1 Tax=uncultured Caudovirales phage TaxID=2100421 RepID=A0A2H4J8D7_9CAUD|nr:hypothetical protein 9F2_28 [uncultured Caudovirales phage]